LKALVGSTPLEAYCWKAVAAEAVAVLAAGDADGELLSAGPPSALLFLRPLACFDATALLAASLACALKP